MRRGGLPSHQVEAPRLLPVDIVQMHHGGTFGPMPNNNNVVWLIVGILAIIALLIFIVQNL